MTTDMTDATRHLLAAFRAWEAECEEEGHTDTGIAWEYLREMAAELKALMGDSTLFTRYRLDVAPTDPTDLDGASDDVLDLVGDITAASLNLGLTAIAESINAQLAEHNIKPIKLTLENL